MLYDVTWRRLMLYDVVWWPMMSYDIVWCCMMLYDIVWHCMTSYNVVAADYIPELCVFQLNAKLKPSYIPWCGIFYWQKRKSKQKVPSPPTNTCSPRVTRRGTVLNSSFLSANNRKAQSPAKSPRSRNLHGNIVMFILWKKYWLLHR